MLSPGRQYQYKVLSKVLTAARADPGVAEGLLKKINTITILDLDGGALDLKLNANTNDTITCSNGLKIEGIPITDIWWINAAQPGLTATIFVAWVD